MSSATSSDDDSLKVAMVTGGSGDIGGTIARYLADAGFLVVLTYAGYREGADRVCETIAEAGGSAEAIQLDQRSPDSIDAARAHVEHHHGRLDVLVNNGAWNANVPFEDLQAMTPDLWDRILETNLRGPFLLVRAMAPLLKANGRGHVINISSIGGISATSGSSLAYAAAKAALNHLTRGLAVALAPDVAVNCVAPGLVEGTRMAERVAPERRERGRQQAVLGRVGALEDIAAQVLAFVRSSSISGQIVAIDGGVPGAMR